VEVVVVKKSFSSFFFFGGGRRGQQKLDLCCRHSQVLFLSYTQKATLDKKKKRSKSRGGGHAKRSERGHPACLEGKETRRHIKTLLSRASPFLFLISLSLSLSLSLRKKKQPEPRPLSATQSLETNKKSTKGFFSLLSHLTLFFFLFFWSI